MPQTPEPLKPTPFDVAPPPVAASEPPPSAGPSRSLPWLGLSLAGLLILALLVFLWLPQQVQDRPAPLPVASEPATDAAQASRPATSTSTALETDGTAAGSNEEPPAPWEEALQAKMRKQAQAILEPLLDLQLTLKEQGVETWAPVEYAAALAQAEAGDALYKQREFEAASAQYEQALAALQALDASRPERLQQLLQETREAIEALDQTAVASALETLAALAPGNPEAAELAERAQSMPRMLELFSLAASAETRGDLAAALAEMDKARTLDPAHQRAADEWARLTIAVEDQLYQLAMSEGYSALATGELAAARAAFKRAGALRPDSGEVDEALRQVENSDTASRLAALSRQGQRQEQQEQWQAAVQSYRKALKLDSTVLFAAEGLTRAVPRATLDTQLQELLDNPGRLSNVAVARDVAAQLEQARTVTPRGPRLADQLDRLQSALDLANTPVPLTLLSDQQTDVVLYKVARLGRFAQRPLELRPGTYTAAGSRSGYRDVRVTFTVRPGEPGAAITVACTEPVR